PTLSTTTTRARSRCWGRSGPPRSTGSTWWTRTGPCRGSGIALLTGAWTASPRSSTTRAAGTSAIWAWIHRPGDGGSDLPSSPRAGTWPTSMAPITPPPASTWSTTGSGARWTSTASKCSASGPTTATISADRAAGRAFYHPHVRIVLAYSGGLDTSVILAWLRETYDAEVVAYTC